MTNCHAPWLITILKIRAASAPKRHADAELLRPLIDRETHHAIETDGGKKKSDHAEDAEELGDQRGPLKNFGVRTRRRAGEIDRQIRIELRDGLAQRGPEILRRLSRVRAHDDGAELRRRACPEQRHIKAAAIALPIEGSLHQRVGDNADDGAPRLRLRGIEDADLMPERALVAPIFARKAGVHDRDRLFRVAIVEE